MGNGHVAYRSHMVTPDVDLSTQLPKVLSMDYASNQLPSIPPTPPEPDSSPPGTSTSSPEHVMVHSHAAAWGRMSRWDRKDRIGEPLQLTGSFAAVGILSQSVHDAQPVCNEWDLRHEVSFALIRQSEPLGSDGPEDVWLYNSGTRPLFICTASSSKPDTLRLSSGYCIRVHKGEATASAPTSERAAQIHRRSNRDPALSQGNLVISVDGGWGPNYNRLYVTDIPCRYEISFSI
ncbi:hypothetical protein KIN20_006747 [Parelaphostrongylus tenuis]|uniref:MH2 domain-containing protein n=1 Tax=Parelaphostrongylus tenuis TaxID=148309 RepID=A0AAD5MN11_PARTN|nr:hypothetical protein KIN20_006747 [Parelaphostrongylus tenuis]